MALALATRAHCAALVVLACVWVGWRVGLGQCWDDLGPTDWLGLGPIGEVRRESVLIARPFSATACTTPQRFICHCTVASL